MKAHPMLFNTEMVKALLTGNKIQTRRPMKQQPEETPKSEGDYWFPSHKCQQMVRISHLKEVTSNDPSFINCVSPWEIGDLIYVRESFQPIFADGFSHEYGEQPDYKTGHGYEPIYPATDGITEYCDADMGVTSKITPSIHMPRWASRLTLKVTGVRIERIQDISEQDAIAEGIKCYSFTPDDGWPPCNGYTHLQEDDGAGQLHSKASGAFGSLWKSAYGDSWEKNEWVWVIDFEVIHQNVDHYLAAQENAA
ncbi:MAG: hypothetical protein MK185_06750 [Saccharospirillaceae bacterium]|nr:hypothetical protein [Saccharospirillaceae bacterium]